jgi:uncharacterized protein YjbJ (UPF0337 family)
MGEWKDKAEGTVKETVGNLTGDESKQTEGQAQQTWGNVQGTANDLKERVGAAVDDAKSDDRDSYGSDNT